MDKCDMVWEGKPSFSGCLKGDFWGLAWELGLSTEPTPACLQIKNNRPIIYYGIV